MKKFFVFVSLALLLGVVSCSAIRPVEKKALDSYRVVSISELENADMSRWNLPESKQKELDLLVSDYDLSLETANELKRLYFEARIAEGALYTSEGFQLKARGLKKAIAKIVVKTVAPVVKPVVAPVVKKIVKKGTDLVGKHVAKKIGTGAMGAAGMVAKVTGVADKFEKKVSDTTSGVLKWAGVSDTVSDAVGRVTGLIVNPL